MTFSKSFPRTVKGSTYPVWEEIFLTAEEEKQEEERCRAENVALMHECIEDAMDIIDTRINMILEFLNRSMKLIKSR